MPSLLSRLSTWTPAFPWVTPRFVGAVVVLALLYAASNFEHVLAVATFVLAAVLAGFLVTDWTIGPRTRDVTVSREPLASRFSSALEYVPCCSMHLDTKRGQRPACGPPAAF